MAIPTQGHHLGRPARVGAVATGGPRLRRHARGARGLGRVGHPAAGGVRERAAARAGEPLRPDQHGSPARRRGGRRGVPAADRRRRRRLHRPQPRQLRAAQRPVGGPGRRGLSGLGPSSRPHRRTAACIRRDSAAGRVRRPGGLIAGGSARADGTADPAGSGRPPAAGRT